MYINRFLPARHVSILTESISQSINQSINQSIISSIQFNSVWYSWKRIRIQRSQRFSSGLVWSIDSRM